MVSRGSLPTGRPFASSPSLPVETRARSERAWGGGVHGVAQGSMQPSEHWSSKHMRASDIA